MNALSGSGTFCNRSNHMDIGRKRDKRKGKEKYEKSKQKQLNSLT